MAKKTTRRPASASEPANTSAASPGKGAREAVEGGSPVRAEGPESVEHEAQLEQLLLSLFDDGDFRRWVARDPGCRVITEKLPGAGASPEALVHAAIGAMSRHGLVDAGLFARLVKKFPKRKADIDPVAAAWARRASSVSTPVGARSTTAHGEATDNSPLRPDVVAYVTWLRKQPTGLNLIGVAGGDMQLALDEVYVPLRFAHGRTGLRLHERRFKKPPDAMDDCRDTFGLPDLFARVPAHAILLGGAGTENTTALRKLVQLCQPSPRGEKAVPTGPATLHLGGGYARVLLNTAGELLHAAAQRDLAQLDEKLYLETCAQATDASAPKRSLGCAVVLVHHARKGGHARAGEALRGSSELHAWGDSNLYLRRDGDPLLLAIEHRAAASSSGLERILGALEDAAAPLSRRELRDACRLRNTTLADALTALQADGRVRVEFGRVQLALV